MNTSETSDTIERYVLTMLVENVPGVTARVVSLFAGRGYNIETICGAPTHDPTLSRITITTYATSKQLEMIMKHLRRLIDVVKLADITNDDGLRREMVLIYVRADQDQQTKIAHAMDMLKGKIVHVDKSHLIIEATGKTEDINALIQFMEPFGIKKLARSGELGLLWNTE